MILGNSPEDIATGLLQFAEQYKARHQVPPPATNLDNEKMTTHQAAKFSGVCVKTFLKWVNKGLIPFYGSERKRFFYKSEVIEAIKTLK